jgi:hypothetical protein
MVIPAAIEAEASRILRRVSIGLLPGTFFALLILRLAAE